MGHRRVRKQWRHLRAGVATSLGPRLPRYHAAMGTRIQHGRADISQSRTLHELAGGPAREHPAHHNEGSSTGRTNVETAQQLTNHQTPSDAMSPRVGRPKPATHPGSVSPDSSHFGRSWESRSCWLRVSWWWVCTNRSILLTCGDVWLFTK